MPTHNSKRQAILPILMVLVVTLADACGASSESAVNSSELTPTHFIVPTVQAAQTATNAVPTHPMPTVSPTELVAACTQNSKLLPCSVSKQGTCYDSYGLHGGRLVILMWVKDLNSTEQPYMKIGATRVFCSVSEFAPGYISCNLPQSAQQELELQLFSHEDNPLYCGKITLIFQPTLEPTRSSKRDRPAPTPEY